MKKVLLPIFSFLLVFGMFFSSFGSASANAATVDDPVVTPVSGDKEFTTTVVPIAGLPGVTELPGGMLVPVGFPAGEAQFGSNGVRVTNFDSGKAAACFSLAAIEVSQGWGGKVGVWDGTKWVLLPTNIAPLTLEGSTTTACATITGNGTYTFIRWVADPTLLPSGKPACSALEMDYFIVIYMEGVLGGQYFRDFYGNFTPNANSWVTYEVRHASPGITGDLSGYTTSDSSGNFDFAPSEFLVPSDGSFTLHFEIPQCYYDWSWNTSS